MDFMKPERSNFLPDIAGWIYEIKYDGYRAKLRWDGESAELVTKNGKDILWLFPEIWSSCKKFCTSSEAFELDGELAILNNEGKADFYALQSRHRLRSRTKINEQAAKRPAAYLAFDVVMLKNKPQFSQTLIKRKQLLKLFMEGHQLPLRPAVTNMNSIMFVPFYKNIEDILELQLQCRSEGVIAKRTQSQYNSGKTNNWIKVKYPSMANCFLTAYDPSNDYFHLGYYQGSEVNAAGKMAHGFSKEEKKTLTHMIKNNGTWDNYQKLYIMEPTLVITAAYTTRTAGDLREPRFAGFQLQSSPADCTAETFEIADLKWPEEVDITSPDKLLWKKPDITKLTYLSYVRLAAPYALPHLKQHLLTLVRFPHGSFEDGFYQKECPDYAPDFVDTHQEDDIRFIVCNHTHTLLWLANQLALEWHIPFETIDSPFVEDIVLDLDPPETSKFFLAAKAALQLKELCDSFHLETFVKFSGNKGLQFYLPLPADTYTWKEIKPVTAAFGLYLTSTFPDLFTMERLKKKRKGRMYVDVPQHAKGKTIIAPYAVRGTNEGLVACPLFWEEVSEDLDRTIFTMDYVIKRLETKGCPLQSMFHARKHQNMQGLLDMIKKQSEPG
ncbi:DNA ligase D [Alteribacillus sp. HJP-4]|uniref:DNA ligase D n=1 Tax=Alteribacillus sp. HJP-4 TaxID=2775394 RepID=UPI0035CD1DF6